MKRRTIQAILYAGMLLLLAGCSQNTKPASEEPVQEEQSEAVEELEVIFVEGDTQPESEVIEETEAVEETEVTEETEETEETETTETEETEETEASEEVAQQPTGEAMEKVIEWNDSWQYAEFSLVHGTAPTLYHSGAANPNGIIIGVNAGHGSVAAQQVKTYCHPDQTPKCTGGSTGEGAIKATGANTGTTFLDGTSEHSITLKLAIELKNQLLAQGYDVLMLRGESDVSMDNIGRTVYANNIADCHLALHYDSSDNDKGLYYVSVPDISSYRSMEPVASHWQLHEALGQAVVQGALQEGVKVYGSGAIPTDLTQTSYSTVPSIDVEVGDRGSDYSQATLEHVARGIVAGLDIYFGQ